MIVDIIAFIDESGDAEGVGDCAIKIATMFSAHLTIVGLPRDIARVPHLSIAPGHILASEHRKAQGVAEAAAIRIAAKAMEAGLTCIHSALEAPAADFPDAAARIARRFDLCILALPEFGADAPYEAIFEMTLLRSGGPVMGVPRGSNPRSNFSSALVAWDAGRAATRGLGDALPLLRLAGKVEITTLLDPRKPIRTPLPDCDIANHVRRHGIECSYVELPKTRTSSRNLLERADEIGADYIVMGAQRHSSLRRAIIGSTTYELMQGSRIPLLMGR